MAGNPGKPSLPHHAGHRQRLRARFRKSGRQALQDYELLELLLGYAVPRRDTKPLAKEIIERFGSVQAFFDAPYGQIEAVEGMGEYASTLIRLVKACMNRYLEPSADGEFVITGPESVIGYLKSEIGGSPREQFMLLCLNSAGRLIHSQVMTEGTVDAAHIYPREVVRTALEKNASALILVHNHPSGTLKASEQDMQLTRLLTDICSRVGIAVHDHLIVSRSGAYSIKTGTTIDL
jgi:DNA repair protein RadC